MSQTFLYPTSAELSQVDKLLLDELTLDDPIFKLFPFKTSKDAMVMWDQEDSTWGLMQARGEGGEFPAIPKFGANRYRMSPGVWGEFDSIDEFTMTMRAGYGTFGTPVDVTDLVTDTHRKLTTRQVNRQRNLMWTLLATGIYNVTDNTGATIEKYSFSPQTFAANVPWATVATATPFQDFQAVQLKDIGLSVKFDGSATAFMSQVTFNYMFNNTNNSDLGRFRLNAGGTLISKTDFDDVLLRNNLPRIVIVSDSYLSDATTGVRFLPDNKVIVVGKRTNNAPLGNFVYTRDVNIDQGGQSEASSPIFVKTIDSAAANGVPPRKISVYRGFKGGPTIKYPQAICIMSV